MYRFRWTFAIGMVLATTSSVDAQVIGGVLSVTQSHMS
jgi:preprotein translocase subunit SecF